MSGFKVFGTQLAPSLRIGILALKGFGHLSNVEPSAVGSAALKPYVFSPLLVASFLMARP